MRGVHLCRVMRLGLVRYGEAYSLQKELLEKRIRGEVPDTLIVLEHEPVFTIGRRGDMGNVLISEQRRNEENIELFQIERGGDVTYHGPGQLVAYPVFDLNAHGKDVHRFIRSLEEVVIGVLSEYGLRGRRIEGLTGVWVGEKKIASIGVAIRKWVSYHGLSLNVSPQMKHFSFINPCGLGNAVMTSMRELLGESVTVRDVEGKLIGSFSQVFDLRLQPESNPCGKSLQLTYSQ